MNDKQHRHTAKPSLGYARTAMQMLILLVLFASSVGYLWYLKEEGIEPVSSWMRRSIAAAKHVIALFTAVFGANAVALLLLVPVLLYAHWNNTETGISVLSALMDRPYFPLQAAVACLLGLTTFGWLKEGWIRFVWILPLIQAIIAVAVFVNRFNPTTWGAYWKVFFDWGCGCSATLPQWTVMLPLYTSLTFAIGATVRSLFAGPTISSLVDEAKA